MKRIENLRCTFVSPARDISVLRKDLNYEQRESSDRPLGTSHLEPINKQKILSWLPFFVARLHDVICFFLLEVTRGVAGSFSARGKWQSKGVLN